MFNHMINHNFRLRNLHIPVVIFLVGILFLSGCVSEENVQSSPVEKEKTTQLSTQPQTKLFFSDTNFSILVNNPEKYKGSEVKISGSIFYAPSKDALPYEYQKLSAFQIRQGKKSETQPNVLVVYNPSEVSYSPKLKTGGVIFEPVCVELTGIFEKPLKGFTLSGETVYVVKANDIKEKDCLYVLYPPEKTLSKPIVKEEDGIKLTISKIEFTDEHTRIYVKIENNRKTEISFNKYSSYLVQNKKKYDQTFAPFEVKVEEPDTDIPAGLITEGWVFFEPINPEKPFTIHLEFSDFEVFPPKEWKWDIEVK